MLTIRSLLAASVVVGLAGTAHASVLYDNINASSSDYFAVTGSFAAEQFTADSSGDVADVKLMVAGDNTNTGGSVLVTLYDDESTGYPDNPVATLGTILDTSLPDNYATTLFDIPASVTGLTSGDPYWIVMQDSSVSPATDIGSNYGGTSIVWFTATSDGGIGVTGGNYVAPDGNVYSNSDSSYGPGIMCVTSSSDDTCPAVPVPSPEPAGIGILAIAMAGLGFARRGRRFAS
jgi:hypothetical protein